MTPNERALLLAVAHHIRLTLLSPLPRANTGTDLDDLIAAVEAEAAPPSEPEPRSKEGEEALMREWRQHDLDTLVPEPEQRRDRQARAERNGVTPEQQEIADRFDAKGRLYAEGFRAGLERAAALVDVDRTAHGTHFAAAIRAEKEKV